MNKITIACLIALIFLLQNCKETFNDDELSLNRVPFLDSSLRIDGYYIHKENSIIYSSYVLYGNGIIRFTGGVPAGEDEAYLEELFLRGLRNDQKGLWGIFLVKDSTITFERWYSSEPPLRAYINEGKILNDTTFIITKTYRKDRVTIKSELYRFKRFLYKPDSTNKFIR